MKTIAKKKKILDRDWILCPEIDFAKFGIVGFHEELRARFFIHAIYFRRILSDLEPDEWVFLPTESLEVYLGGCGPHIKKTREVLEEAGLIECDHKAIWGKKVFGYRIGPALADVKFAKWAIGDKTYVKRFNAYRNHLARPRNLSPVGFYLKDHAAQLVKSSRWDEVYDEIRHIKGGVEQVIGYLDNGYFEWSECPMGRFHSLFTRMPSELRQSFADKNGNDLVEIDITNSQMYYLLNLIEDVKANPEKYSRKIKDENVEQQIEKANMNGEWIKYRKQYKPSREKQAGRLEQGKREEDQGRQIDQGETRVYTLVQSINDLLQSDDFTQFTSDVLSGQIYERWQAHRRFATRAEAKINIFEILYGGSYTKAMIFNELYPTVGRLIEVLKSIQGYWFVGRTLQRMESARVIQGVCGRLMREHPDWAVLTCHDSLAVAPQNVDSVIEIILDIHRDLPHPPKLKVKS